MQAVSRSEPQPPGRKALQTYGWAGMPASVRLRMCPIIKTFRYFSRDVFFANGKLKMLENRRTTRFIRKNFFADKEGKARQTVLI